MTKANEVTALKEHGPRRTSFCKETRGRDEQHFRMYIEQDQKHPRLLGFDPDFRTLSLLLAHANPQNAAHCTFTGNRPKPQPDRAC